MSKLIIASFFDYFSTRQHMERRLLFYINKRNRLDRLFQAGTRAEKLPVNTVNLINQDNSQPQPN
jgi:hypothetical protein